MRWIALLPLGVLVALGVLFATFGLHHDPHFIPRALVGQQAPAETLPALAGGAPTPLKATLKGRPAVVNFFASWCVPCADEAPALMALKDEGVPIIGVAYKDDPARTRDFLARLGDPFQAVLVDQSGRAGVDFGVSGVPETYLVDADGRVLAKYSGALDPKDAETLLEKTQAPGGPASAA